MTNPATRRDQRLGLVVLCLSTVTLGWGLLHRNSHPVLAAASVSPRPNQPAQAARALHASNIPVTFVRDGESDGYLVESPNQTIRFGRSGLSIDKTTTDARAAITVQFVGATPVSAKPIGQPSTVNYFVGAKKNWRTGIPATSHIRYTNPWPGIDADFQGTGQNLEATYTVAPYADPRHIRLRYEGQSRLRVDPSGNLITATAAGDVVESAPVTYQLIADRKVIVPSRFVLHDDQTVGFAIGAYDVSRELVVDPTFVYGADLFGPNAHVHGVAVNDAGEVLVAFRSANSLATVVAKINSTGDGLVFTTYLGGSDTTLGQPDANPAGIAVDGRGDVYVVGMLTNTTDFPVVIGPALTPGGGGNQDGFITKLSGDGSTILYSGYIGGNDGDSAAAVAVDGAGNAYVTGMTGGGDFPVLIGPSLKFTTNVLTGYSDAFVAKIDPAGHFAYCGYIGGLGHDMPTGIAVDAGGSAYVVGETNDGAGFPVKGGPSVDYRGGDGDGFISKITPDGSSFVYSGFLGGAGRDAIMSVAVDAAGAAYVAGGTNSDETSFPIAVGPSLTNNSRAYNAQWNDLRWEGFVTKIAPDGLSLEYSGFLGGTLDDFIYALALDDLGNAYVTGSTNSGDFPAINGPGLTYGHDFYSGITDGFVAEIDNGGSSLRFSGYFSSTDYVWGQSIAVSKAGDVYVVGYFPPADTTVSSLGSITQQTSATSSGEKSVAYDLFVDHWIASSDFNRDQHSDVLWHNPSTGQSTIWRSGSFANRQPLSTVSDPAWRIASKGDFDGDRATDLLWHNTISGASTIWKAGNSTNRQAVSQVSDVNWEIVASGDFDKDGRTDLFWRNRATGANAIWRSANKNTSVAVASVTDLHWSVAGSGDFNADGKADILWRNQASGANAIWLSGTNSMSMAVAGVSNLDWAVAGVGDFDADGAYDILWRNRTTGANVIWLGARSSRSIPVTAVINLAWSVAAVGDYNSDGRSDVLWRNPSVGTNVIWFSANGATSQLLSPVAGNSWVVER